MKSFILIDKKTGVIVEGVPILFWNNLNYEIDSPVVLPPNYQICLSKNHPDGWLINNPEGGKFWWFMNLDWVTMRFEVLGEL